MANFVAERLANGFSREQVTNGLVDMGFPAGEAAGFVDRVYYLRKENLRRDGISRFASGIALIIIGTAVTLGTWYWAGPGGTYVVTYGLFVLGGIFALWGGWKTLVNHSGLVSFLKWATILAVVVGLVYAGGIYAIAFTNADAPPPNSTIDWQPRRPAMYNTGDNQHSFLVSGAIINTDTDWSIENVVLEVTPVETSSNKDFQTIYVEVEPNRIGPGQAGKYSARLTFPQYADSYTDILVWEWSR